MSLELDSYHRTELSVTLIEELVVMKLKWLIVSAMLLLAPSMVMAEETPWSPKLPFEQAVITYEISGMEEGQEVLYIRDFGQSTARHRQTSTTMLGITQKSSSVEIVTPEWVYNFDLREGAGSKSVNPQKLMSEEYNKLTDAEKKKVDENAGKMAGVLAGGGLGSVELNVRQILGYSCDRIIGLGSTVYSIHDTGISLLTETDLLGIKMKSVATSIKKSGADKIYFEFPQGIVPQPNPEADHMARLIAQQSIAALQDPESFQSKGQGIMGLPAGGQPAIPEEDQIQMKEAMETIKGLLGN